MNPPPVNTSAPVTPVSCLDFILYSRVLLVSHWRACCGVINISVLLFLMVEIPFLCAKKPKTTTLATSELSLACVPGERFGEERGDTFASLTDGSLFLAFSLPLSLPHSLNPKHRHRHTRLH